MSENRNLKIQLNKTIIDRTKAANIQMDLMGTVMFVLFGLFDGQVELLDHCDDANKQRSMGVLYKQLERRGFIEEVKDGKVLWKLTPMGNEFVTHLREEYEEELKEEKSDDDPIVGDVAAHYIALWPKGLVDNKRLREHPDAVISRLKSFVKRYGQYDKGTILAATKLYLEEQSASAEGHRYTRNNKYFIWKDTIDQSDLATWCQRVVDGDEPVEWDTKDMDII